jgi:RNA polymerase sigma factor (sigma-70 family)
MNRQIGPLESGLTTGTGTGIGTGTGDGADGVSGADGVGADDATHVFSAAAVDFAAWREGDRSALDRLVAILTPVLWQVVRAYRLDRPTAEDVVQATWMALVRKGHRIEEPQAVVRWLTVTARREAWRSARRRPREEPTEDDVLDRFRATAEEPETAALREGRDRALWTAFRQLSVRCQRLLRVVASAERPDYTRLAAELGMARGSIGPTRARCLARLRTMLGGMADWRTA